MSAPVTGGLQGLADFLDSFMGGFGLIGFSIALGTLIWMIFILGFLPLSQDDKAQLNRLSLRWLSMSAYFLAATHAITLIAKGVVLKDTLGHLPLEAYMGTTQFQAGFIRMLLSLGLAVASGRWLKKPHQSAPRYGTWGLMAAIVVSGAWLTHGVGRFDNREGLMALTIVHQIAGAIWFGGVVQLILFWRWIKRNPSMQPLWPQALGRFSLLGVTSVAVLVFSGIPLAWSYVDNLTALIGTGYGSLLMIKTILLLSALGLAWINQRAAKRWHRESSYPPVFRAIPHVVEAESFLLISILFVAATLSSQPPAVDIPQLIATPSEVWQMFSPKLPHLVSPSHEELMIGEAQRATIVGKESPVFAVEWSNFNHNVSGVILTAMAAVALMGYLFKARWAYYWPAGFIVLGIFIFFRADAQAWPMGPMGFWESTFGDGEILQHRLATLLTFLLGGLEIRARTNAQAKKLRYLFPILCALGGILLLTHSHSGFELKTEYLIQSTHMAMGLFAIFMAASRWLELKLEPPYANWAGIVSTISMGVIGLIMVFYDEPLY